MARLPSEKSVPYRRGKWLKALPGMRPKQDERKDPDRPDFVPDTHYELVEAIDRLGAACVEGWDGTERHARKFNRPPDPPWLWYGSQQTDAGWTIISDDGQPEIVSERNAKDWWLKVEPELRAEATAEAAAVTRWEECTKRLRNEAAKSAVRSEILTRHGRLFDVNQSDWLSDRAEEALHTGMLEIVRSGGYGSSINKIRGLVVFERESFEAMLAPKAEGPPSDAQVDPDRFPYLAFMLRVATHFSQAPEGRIPSDQLKAWISENWSTRLGRKTDAKIANMATFLRRPEDEKGGNFSQRSGPSSR